MTMRSFITTVNLQMLLIETVSKLLGHTSIKTTQIYAKVIEQKISNDMRNLRDALLNKNEKTSNVKVING